MVTSEKGLTETMAKTARPKASATRTMLGAASTPCATLMHAPQPNKFSSKLPG